MLALSTGTIGAAFASVVVPGAPHGVGVTDGDGVGVGVTPGVGVTVGVGVGVGQTPPLESVRLATEIAPVSPSPPSLILSVHVPLICPVVMPENVGVITVFTLPPTTPPGVDAR